MTSRSPTSAFAPRRRSPRAPERGAVLIVALLIMAVLALGLTSYLGMNVNSARQAQRGFQQAAAFNLAEAGAEEALWSFNQANAGSGSAWDGWTVVDPAARRTFSGFDLGNATGSVKVYVDNYSPGANSRPTVVALASVSATGGATVEKMIEVLLRRRSRFSAGLMAKEAVTFSGNRASVDSWNSDPDNNAATAPVAYSAAVRRDRGSVASVSVATRSVLINQANVWGYVYTGGAQPDVGRNGSITGADTPAGVTVDTSRISTDFSATFPNVTAPVDGTPIATLGATLGTAGESTRWRTPSISLSGKQTLTILGDVTLILTAGNGARAIDITGTASLIIPDGSSLTIYVEGDVLIAGRGLANANVRPASCLIYGTNPTDGGQSIQIAGNGALSAAVYAPNADIRINGNGDILGAAVGRSIDLTGNADFHYDESLGNFDSGMPFGVERWREITTSTGRGTRAGHFEGW